MKKNEIIVEREFKAPDHEMSPLAKTAAAVAQKINSGEPMEDRDYNQLAELGAILSRVGTSFDPKSMKDVFAHMVQFTNDRNAEQKPSDQYPRMTPDRFKELLALAN